MNEIYEIDRQYGISKEITFLDKLKSKFGEDIRRIEGRYNQHDYENDECIFELKSRRCLKETYPTTMIGLNKLEKFKQKNKRIILCFSFVDTDAFYEYNPNDSIEIKRGGRKDRGLYEYGQYAYIPIELLEDF